MRYIPHTESDVQRMLEAIGASSVEELFEAIPEQQRLGRPLDLRRAASEQELWGELTELASHNANTDTHACFLGAGVYPHFTPSAVDSLTSRSEFTTAYTPYQPEISQGTLQTIFEWQTMICGLTGCDVSNASMYDGASATAEAALMAMRATRRSKVVVATGLHPHYREVLRTYLDGLRAEIVEAPLAADGRTGSLVDWVDDATACVVLQQPNFLGAVEDVRAAAEAAAACGAKLAVSVTEALSLALLAPPGELGADIVCGEAQSFGVPMSLGGPHLGFIATRQKLLRQLPGRLVGETLDTEGRRGYVLTLATREQHIRREKATSNICTNQGLCLLMATIYLSLYGPRGLRELAELNHAKAEYAKSKVREHPTLSLPLDAPTFNEFVVAVPDTAAAIERARADQMLAGLDLTPYYPQLGSAMLVCTTELVSREAIDRLIVALAGAAS